MCTLVVGVAAMVSLMESTTDTKEMASCALSTAKLDICFHLDDHVIESSAQVVYGGMLPLESCQIAIQPGSDVIDTPVDQSIEVCSKFLDQLRVGHELPWRARSPGLQ
jgi:hypothetical protein